MHKAERSIADHRNNLTGFVVHGKLTVSGAELAAEMAASNRGVGGEGGSGPSHSPKNVELANSRLLGSLSGREAAKKDDNIMEDMVYREREGGSVKATKGLMFTLRDQTQIRHFGHIFFVPPYLLIGPVLFRLRTKDLAYSI